MVKSILLYPDVLHSPNLHQLFILAWSANFLMVCVLDLHFILSDRGWEEMVIDKSISQYLSGMHLPNLHQLFILKQSTNDVAVCVLDLVLLKWPWLGRNGELFITVPRCATFTIPTPIVHLDMIYRCCLMVCFLDLHFTLQWPRHKMTMTGPLWWFPSQCLVSMTFDRKVILCFSAKSLKIWQPKLLLIKWLTCPYPRFQRYSRFHVPSLKKAVYIALLMSVGTCSFVQPITGNT